MTEPTGPLLTLATTWPRPGVCLVRVAGDLDLYTVPLLRDHLRAQADGRPTHLLLDLDAVALVAATGISLVLAATRNEHGIHGRLALIAHPTSAVVRVLRLTGVAALLPVHDSIRAALDAVDAY